MAERLWHSVLQETCIYTCRGLPARVRVGSLSGRVLVARPLFGYYPTLCDPSGSVTAPPFDSPVARSVPPLVFTGRLPAIIAFTMPFPARWITGPGREIVPVRQPNSHGPYYDSTSISCAVLVS